jgi:hypothetical protein
MTMTATTAMTAASPRSATQRAPSAAHAVPSRRGRELVSGLMAVAARPALARTGTLASAMPLTLAALTAAVSPGPTITTSLRRPAAGMNRSQIPAGFPRAAMTTGQAGCRLVPRTSAPVLPAATLAPQRVPRVPLPGLLLREAPELRPRGVVPQRVPRVRLPGLVLQPVPVGRPPGLVLREAPEVRPPGLALRRPRGGGKNRPRHRPAPARHASGQATARNGTAASGTSCPTSTTGQSWPRTSH